MNIKEFISHLHQEIETITKFKHHYIGFILISQAIEVLGAVFDHDDLEKMGKSEKRFELAIENLFSSRYKVYRKQLFEHLRCGFTHQLRPTKETYLTSSNTNGADPEFHLKKENGHLIIVYEELLKDFISACKKCIAKIDDPKESGRINHIYRTMDFLTVHRCKKDSTAFIVSAGEMLTFETEEI